MRYGSSGLFLRLNEWPIYFFYGQLANDALRFKEHNLPPNSNFSLLRINPTACQRYRPRIFYMSTPTTEIPPQTAAPTDKELNFRALEQKYQRQLDQERSARIEAERQAQEAMNRKQSVYEEEDDDGEPYVDKKKLDKKLAKFGEQAQKQTQSDIQRAVQQALQEERKQNWLKSNGDFYDVLGHAEKLAQMDPELAETILSMPEGFERQKLVYKNIKALGLHQEKKKDTGIQDKIDQNRRTPYYQPSGISAGPYSQVGDFSETGQKQAYQKMKDLQNKLRG